MFVRAPALHVDEAQKSQLESMARAGTTPQKTARKCQVILLASQGLPNSSIAQRTGCPGRLFWQRGSPSQSVGSIAFASRKNANAHAGCSHRKWSRGFWTQL